MARGSISKENVTKRILEVFEGSFINGKEIRIPMNENGEILQIKCVLTCAKTNVDNGSCASNTDSTEAQTPVSNMMDMTSKEITQEEKDIVQDLLTRLNIGE